MKSVKFSTSVFAILIILLNVGCILYAITSTSKPIVKYVIVKNTTNDKTNENRIIEPHRMIIRSGIPREYTQLGYLKGSTNDTDIYPLYGRASKTNAHRWNYHTITNRPSNNIRLPIQSSDGRECTLDIGCNELYDGDRVTIPGVPGQYEVNLYNKDFLYRQ